MVRMRVIRRYPHYPVGEVIAVPLHEGRDLEVKRLAQPLDILVPAAAGDGQEAATASAARAPASVVRK
jgi:hypothetical protein